MGDLFSDTKNDKGQVLCKACGLCCGGFIFDFIPLGDDEDLESLKEMGADYSVVDNRNRLPSPCFAWRNGMCGVYPKRPDACRKYTCKLFKRYLHNDIDWESAMNIVQDTRTHIKAFEELLDTVYRVPSHKSILEVYRCFKEFHGEKSDPVAFRKKYGKIMVEFASYQVRIERYFVEK